MPIYTGVTTRDGEPAFFAVMAKDKAHAADRARRSGLKDAEIRDVADFPQSAEPAIEASPGTVFLWDKAAKKPVAVVTRETTDFCERKGG